MGREIIAIFSLHRESSSGLEDRDFAMADEFDRAKDLFKWNERIFTIVGAWPLQSSYVKFCLCIVYFLTHMSSLYADFFYVFGDLELMILNLMETTWGIMILLKLLVMRFSRTVASLTKGIVDSIDRSHFESSEEMRIYLKYNRIAKKYFKLWLTIEITGSTFYTLRPLMYRFQAGLRNESMPFVLSYRARFFFEVNDTMTFWLVWVYQAPLVCFNISLTMTISYVFTLTLHVSGLLSVLTFRIHNLQLDTRKDESSRNIFRDIVTRHHNVLRMVEDINGAFGMLLLEEVMILTVLLGLSSYSVIVNIDLAEPGELIIFFIYAGELLWMIYGYCLAGEYLVVESMELFKAYFQCQWYNMSDSFNKQLIICMMGASKPTHLTAGGFYHFSLEGYTSILKTSAGYISMLRAVV